MGATIAEKILADAANQDRVTPGQHVVCDVDLAAANDMSSIAAIEMFDASEIESVWDPSKVVFAMDHFAPSHTVDDANDKRRIREFVHEQGIDDFYDVGRGILHEVLHENGHVRPGELIVGGDSHTISECTFGAAATGVGDYDITYVLATGRTWLRVPRTIEITVTGEFPPCVSTKDLVLEVAGEYGTDVARYRSIEYTGEAIEQCSIDERVTLANMGIELGGMFTFTPIDDVVTDYVDERTDEPYEPRRADDDAEYHRTYEFDASELEPKVAIPHEVGSVRNVGSVAGTELDQVFIGSCTNGQLADLRAAAEILRGRETDRGTRLIVTPASLDVHARAEREGLIDIFLDANAMVTSSSCGTCIGMSSGILGDGETCLAAQNRNYRGRMGADSSEVYLSSPETAAASAITGQITDPREVA